MDGRRVIRERDNVHRRLVVEFGLIYAYVYLTDANGKILEEECFRQPFRQETKDIAEESRWCFDYVYEWCQDNILDSLDQQDDPPTDSAR